MTGQIIPGTCDIPDDLVFILTARYIGIELYIDNILWHLVWKWIFRMSGTKNPFSNASISVCLCVCVQYVRVSSYVCVYVCECLCVCECVCLYVCEYEWVRVSVYMWSNLQINDKGTKDVMEEK